MTHMPQDIPVRGWTPGRKARFLDRLAVHGNVREACRCVGLSAEAAYRLRRRDEMFARGWAAALVLARQNCEQVLGERAVEGVEEDIFYRGELVGTRRRYDSRLLLAHLARLDRLEDGAGSDAGRFDEILASVADPRTELPPRPDKAAKPSRPSFEQLMLEDYLGYLEELGMTPAEADLYSADAAFHAMLEEEGLEHIPLGRIEETPPRPEPQTGAQTDTPTREESLRSVYGSIDRLCDTPPRCPAQAMRLPRLRAAPARPRNARPPGRRVHRTNGRSAQRKWPRIRPRRFIPQDSVNCVNLHPSHRPRRKHRPLPFHRPARVAGGKAQGIGT